MQDESFMTAAVTGGYENEDRLGAEKLSLEAVGRFVEASVEIRFGGENGQLVYGWVECVLVQQKYSRQGTQREGWFGAISRR